MKNIIKLTALYFVLLFGASSVCGQSYVRLSQASGVDTDANQAELTTAAQAIVDALPAEFQDKFKVYDIGFYVYNELMNGGLPSVWEHAINTASAQSDYYLLFGKETDASGVYNTFYVDLKLPSTGPFECMDEIYYEVIKNSVEKPLNTIHANNAAPEKYYEAELVALQNLKVYISKLSDCCANGSLTPGCGSCLLNYSEIQSVLRGRGFTEYHEASVHVEEYSGYTNIESEYRVSISRDYLDSGETKTFAFDVTDELDGVVGLLGEDKSAGKVHYFSELNCSDFLDFAQLPVAGNAMVQDVVILNFGGVYKVFEQTQMPVDNQSFFRKYSQEQRFFPVAAWLIKKVFAAAVSIGIDFCLEWALEKWIGGHETWSEAYDGFSYPVTKVISAGVDGLTADKKLFEISAAIGVEVMNYLITLNDFSGAGITAGSRQGGSFSKEACAQAIVKGFKKGVESALLGKLMGKASKKLSKHAKSGTKALIPNRIILRSSYFRKKYADAIFPHLSKSSVVPNGSSGTKLYKSQIRANGAKLDVNYAPKRKQEFEAFKAAGTNTDKGKAAEQLSRNVMKDMGYNVQKLHYGSNNGIDYIAYKRKNGKIVDVIVVESKSAGFGDHIPLGTASYGDQMGTNWIRHNLKQIADGNGEVSQEIRDLCFDIRKKGNYKRAVTSINVDNESLDLTFLEIFK